jgi:hypothetical protein
MNIDCWAASGFGGDRLELEQPLFAEAGRDGSDILGGGIAQSEGCGRFPEPQSGDFRLFMNHYLFTYCA